MGRETVRRSAWRLRSVVPGLIAAVLLLDAGMRFMPIEPLTFRAWETLLRNRPPGEAFEPNRRYYNPRSYGDLAAMGNFPDLRQLRPEQFTTDALGFRNDPRILSGEVDAILAGDSFAAGSGVNDDQTLSSQLSELTGCVVYNAGSDQWRVTADEILALARRLHLRNRLVIRLYTEDAEVPGPLTRREKLISTLVARTPTRVLGVVGRVRGLLTVSPLQSLSTHAWKAVADGRLLPNRYAGNVVRATLDNGQTMLFRTAWVRDFYGRRKLALHDWQRLHDDLQKARLDLLVVLVPSKYRIYRPFLVNQPPVDPGAGDYLERLDSALRAMGIRVLDLTPTLSEEAAARYVQHGEYLYWLDDLHWNARGIAQAVWAMRNPWSRADAPCRPPEARKQE